MPAPKPRTFRVDADPDLGEVADEQIHQLYHECAVIQSRLGGAILVVPDRRQLGDGTFVNVSLIAKWESFVPTLPIDAGEGQGYEQPAVPLSDEQAEALSDDEAIAYAEGRLDPFAEPEGSDPPTPEVDHRPERRVDEPVEELRKVLVDELPDDPAEAIVAATDGTGDGGSDHLPAAITPGSDDDPNRPPDEEAGESDRTEKGFLA